MLNWPSFVACCICMVALTPTLLAQESAKEASSILVVNAPTVEEVPFLPPQLTKRLTTELEVQSVIKFGDWFSKTTGITVEFTGFEGHEDHELLRQKYKERLIDQPVHLLLSRLRHYGLIWHVENDVVHITPNDYEYITTRIYDLNDLLAAGYSQKTLLKYIVEESSGLWLEVDSEGGTATSYDELLIIRQISHVQWQVSVMLTALRKAEFHSTFASYPLDKTEEEQRIEKTLQQKISVDFDNVPLSKFAETLGKMSNLNISVDETELNDDGHAISEPVSLKVNDKSLADILRMSIEGLGLTYVIDSGTVTITTQVGCDITVKRLYDVREICPDQFAADSLENVIKRQSSGLWLDIDHEGGSVSHLKPGIIIIRQSPEVQDEISEMLMRIREMKATNSNLPKFVDHLLTRYYRVDADLAESLEKSLWKLVEVGPDDDPKLKEIVVIASGSAETLQATMVITHRRSVHRQIEEVIERIQSGDPPLDESENIGTEIFRQPPGKNDPNMGFGGEGFGGGFF